VPPKKSENTFCILPWLALEVRSEGTMAVCCNSRETLRNGQGQNLNAHRDSLEEAFHSPDRARLKANLFNGVADSNCDRCWRDEKAGTRSRRQLSNKLFTQQVEEIHSDQPPRLTGPLSLDLKFSNLCNQKCRICGPDSSTLWAKEIGWETAEINWGRDNPQLWALLRKWLPSVTRLDLFGGEPFMIPECEKVLSLAVELGVSKQIKVGMSSNGSFFPRNLVENILPHFRKLALYLSLDGTSKQFEYQRHPARWNQALEVYKKFRNNDCFAGISLAVSAFNIYDLPDYLKFWKELGEDRIQLITVFSPEHLSISILPPELKKIVNSRLLGMLLPDDPQAPALMSLIRHMEQSNREDLWPEFVRTVQALDRIRGEDFRKVFPEYYEAAKQHWDV
jgi:MoaA/NifB/PqqE/SkfB family radical SAM enzyme